ncbi:Cro/Cl family transcriptional regulator [Kosakonia cowanii]|uniref:Cro/Cl family transcriptional regulator n=1 Tax=Kosakonia cowanii TaxID=208223 RepID=UPI0025A98578|nr:Cro/Cl family transcriptional regulator [Kosakonia cowanii]MDM9616746.1 Cro/Cl family transcriptional regulator [Kosakonia cowanii]MDP4561613.1 Cro/Cl family transcriptional regulator [Kosakonia cowanii]
MSDAKSMPSHPLSGSQMQFSTFSHGQMDELMSALLPALQTLIRSAMSDAMTVKDFAAMRGISERLVWQWLDEGVLLKAPTREHTDAGKRSRTLINVKAWRDKLTQQAIDCRYIDRCSATSFG